MRASFAGSECVDIASGNGSFGAIAACRASPSLASGHPFGTQDPDKSLYTCRQPGALSPLNGLASLDAKATGQHT